MVELFGPICPRNKPYIDGALRGEPQRFEREIPDPAGGPPRQSLATYTPDIEDGRVRGFVVLVTDITDRKLLEEELRRAKESAEASLTQAKTLKGLLPICSWCGKIRDDAGYWSSIEPYLMTHTDAQVSHGICMTCAETHFAASSEQGSASAPTLALTGTEKGLAARRALFCCPASSRGGI